jgi:hypothetical protein
MANWARADEAIVKHFGQALLMQEVMDNLHPAECHHLANGDLVLCEEGKRLSEVLDEALGNLMDGCAEMHFEPYHEAMVSYQQHVKACTSKDTEGIND